MFAAFVQLMWSFMFKIRILTKCALPVFVELGCLLDLAGRTCIRLVWEGWATKKAKGQRCDTANSRRTLLRYLLRVRFTNTYKIARNEERLGSASGFAMLCYKILTWFDCFMKMNKKLLGAPGIATRNKDAIRKLLGTVCMRPCIGLGALALGMLKAPRWRCGRWTRRHFSSLK